MRQVQQGGEEADGPHLWEGGAGLKLNIVREEEGYLELDFGGEGHSLLNLLQSVLTHDPDV
jgi:hypothetical protein